MTDFNGIKGIEGIPELGVPERGPSKIGAGKFADALEDAIQSVDELQKQSETAQQSFANGAGVELHDVLIKVEEADIAFRTMMEVRNKLLDAYREVLRMGSGG